MKAEVIWLFIFVLLYWAYCIYWGCQRCDDGQDSE